MSWHDDDFEDRSARSGRVGGDWSQVRPTLDNPMSWSVPMGRVWGIDVRVHFFLILFFLIQLGKVVFESTSKESQSVSLGFLPSVIQMTGLFWLILAHEFGHCFACRRVGGEADEILMWPLGGLAQCRPPQTWRANLVTVLGGPMVNVVVFAVTAPLVGLASGEWFGTAIPNPFTLNGLLLMQDSWWTMALYLVHWTNLALILFNLLPMYPMDGGRMMQALLWSRIGYSRSVRLSVYVGYFFAFGMGVVGVVLANMLLVTIAVFGGIVCYTTLRQLKFTDEFMGFAVEDQAYEAAIVADDPERREMADSAEVDRVLQKIAESGMKSLTRAERRLLKQETDRKRRAASGG